jgi:hypothetical protein
VAPEIRIGFWSIQREIDHWKANSSHLYKNVRKDVLIAFFSKRSDYIPLYCGIRSSRPLGSYDWDFFLKKSY